MHVISRDAPYFYVASVAKDRLPVFRTDEIKTITCAQLSILENEPLLMNLDRIKWRSS